ncbi:hypothetical protein MPSEU_000122700 [Mayamaea pseudoterrestris]|nr:hypothetical protein MPSEU_000122700 [Mayamaea pseudoterrestris]
MNYTLSSLTNPAAYRYVLGLLFIFLQCIVWILAAIITQYLYDALNFQSPFLMSYIGMSLLAVFLPVKLMQDRRNARTKDKAASIDSKITQSHQSANSDSKVSQSHQSSVASYADFSQETTKASRISDYYNLIIHQSHNLIHDHISVWNHSKHVMAAAYIAPAMFGADWAFNAALSNTSVASATVLVSTQSVLVFLLAVFLRLEGYRHAKLVGVLLSVVGTALTAVQDSNESSSIFDVGNDDMMAMSSNNKSAVYGDLFAVLAAVGYAVYTIQVRVFCPQNEELYSMQLLLGYIGCFCFVPLLPVAIYILASAQIQLTWAIFGLILIKGAMDFVLTDYLLFRSIILTNATIATVGLGLTIPMAFLADAMLGKAVGTVLSFAGAVAVSIGFLVVNLAGDDSNDKANDHESDDTKREPLSASMDDAPSIQIV